MKVSTVAVTGATGFVGRQILKRLVEVGANVRIIVRTESAVRIGRLAPCVEVVETDDLFSEPRDRLSKLLEGVETLVHAAWYAEPGKYLISERNLDCLMGTLRLAEALADAGGRRFVGIGTCFEYDLAQGKLSVETPLKPQTLYAACKGSVFQVLTHLLPARNVEFVWCRLFYLYGENEDPRRLVPYLRSRLSAGEIAELTSGNQLRDFLDVSKAGAMVVDAALGHRTGPMNICSGVPITVRQLAERIADEFGRRDLLRFGARPDNLVDPPCVVGILD